MGISPSSTLMAVSHKHRADGAQCQKVNDATEPWGLIKDTPNPFCKLLSGLSSKSPLWGAGSPHAQDDGYDVDIFNDIGASAAVTNNCVKQFFPQSSRTAHHCWTVTTQIKRLDNFRQM